MKRRFFLKLSTVGALSMLFLRNSANGAVTSTITAGNPSPSKTITAAVDTVLPEDPEVENDFKASDYGADKYLAIKLGYLGQLLMLYYLNKYSLKVAGRTFLGCNPEQRKESIKMWFFERESCSKFEQDMLSGLISMTASGTFEGLEKDEREKLYEAMGWFDPQDPDNTFHLPCNGYTDFS
ncbi:MAG: hypothetical protein GY710_17440 [Desulfobacteraceae bacterium]|nr:hypothetical protein [Desulfobacteraceae bacterium]